MKYFFKKYEKPFIGLFLAFILVFGIFLFKFSYGFFFAKQNFHYLKDAYIADCSSQFEEYSDSLNFTKIENFKRGNLKDRSTTDEGSFVWIKIPFTLPEDLVNHDLGFVIPYLTFSEKAWCNGNVVGSFGRFPPNQISVQHQAHLYMLPKEILNQSQENNLILKVYLEGNCSLSDNFFISDYEQAVQRAKDLTCLNSRLYMIFVSGMLGIFFIFLFVFLCNTANREYLHFSLNAFFTCGFVCTFFAIDLPFYTSIPPITHLLFMKIFGALFVFMSIFFSASFLVSFFKVKEPKIVTLIRIFLLAVALILTFISTSFKSLLSKNVIFATIVVLILAYGIFFVISQFFKPNNKKNKTLAMVLLLSLAPTLIALVIDLIVLLKGNNLYIPYVVIFGWQISLLTLTLILAYRYIELNWHIEKSKIFLEGKVSQKIQELKDTNKQLENTNQQLENANQQLELEREKTVVELNLASSMQKKILPPANKIFSGWDISIVYEPLQKVSGDLYDYFDDGTNLNGFSLFDISGHGLSASMISVLAKNIIRKNFLAGLKDSLSSEEILEKISSEISEEKGDVDNYLTGIILSIEDFTKTRECKIHLANGAHPYPILYRAASETTEEIFSEEEHFGAVGIKDIEVLFSKSDFDMAVDDILVLFTDGLIDSENEEKESFGREKIKEVVAENSQKSAQEIVGALKNSLVDFISPLKFQDDVTIVVMKRI